MAISTLKNEAWPKEGAKVAVFERDSTAGKETVDEIIQDGGQASFFKVDIANENDVKQAVQDTVETYGKIDVYTSILPYVSTVS